MSSRALGRRQRATRTSLLRYFIAALMVVVLEWEVKLSCTPDETLPFLGSVDAYDLRQLSQHSDVPGRSKSFTSRSGQGSTTTTASENDLSHFQLIKTSGIKDYWILVEGDAEVPPDLSQQLSATSSEKATDNTPEHRDIDESEEEEQEEEEEEEEEMSKFAVLTAVECIVVVLIIMTIGFEEMKEYVEEHSSRDLHPIIDSLFGEMTILGFLSAFTFVLTKIGLFEHLSAWLFGENERDFLIEAFETVHFTLFFIMVCFVMQALCLMKDASHAEEEWLKLDAACQNDQFRRLHERKLREKRQQHESRRTITGKRIKKRLPTMSTSSSSMSSAPSFLRLVSSVGENTRKKGGEERGSLMRSLTRAVSYGALTHLRKDSRQPNLEVLPSRESSSLGSAKTNRTITNNDEIFLGNSSSSEEWDGIKEHSEETNDNGEEETISDELKIFDALRKEFILDRGLRPPFAPKPVEQRLPSDFNFGRYLAMCLGKTIAKAVNVNIETWYSVIFFSLGFYFIGLFVNLVALSVIWTILGYLSLAFSLYFEVYLMQLRNAFIPRNIFKPIAQGNKENENGCRSLNRITTLSSAGTKQTTRTSSCSLNGNDERDDESISSEDDNEEIQQMLLNLQKKGYLAATKVEDPSLLPQWCTFEKDDYAKRRGTILMSMTSSLIAEDPTKANRQEKCFWGGKKGIKVHTIALQLNLVFTGVYCAFQIIVFLPVIWETHQRVGLHWTIFVLYLILSIIPVVGLVYNKATLVSTLSLVGSIGCHRSHQTTAGVLREEKTARAVRSIVVIHSLYNAVNKEENHSSYNITCQRRPLCHYALLQISNIFDTFDKNKDGVLSHEELRDILTSLPGDVSHEQVHQVIQTLDADGSGDISREEFIRWCVDRMGQEHNSSDETSNQLAHDLFHMFDHDGSGEITIGEFKSTLDNFNLNFTLEEVGDIVRQLDENGDGMIGVEEFEEMLERFKIKLFENDDDNDNQNGSSHHSFYHEEIQCKDDPDRSDSSLLAAEMDDIMVISSMHSRGGSSMSLGQTSDADMDGSVRTFSLEVSNGIPEVPIEETDKIIKEEEYSVGLTV